MSTVPGLEAPAPSDPVFNAFRHHGEADGRRATRASSRTRGAQRLPASRRDGHLVAQGYDASDITCSTPSGITARRTYSPASLGCTAGRSAQRLPASRRGGRARSRGWAELLRVLNAFRHLGEADHHPELPVALHPGVLNAFRHLGEADYEVHKPEGVNSEPLEHHERAVEVRADIDGPCSPSHRGAGPCSRKLRGRGHDSAAAAVAGHRAAAHRAACRGRALQPLRHC